MTARSPLRIRWLGRVEYDDALERQHELVDARRRDQEPDTLLLLEHDPVITLGRRGGESHLESSRDSLDEAGIALRESERGGDVTYHGPGQLIGYPVVALEESRRDAHRYLRDLEQALIDLTADYDIAGRRVEGLTGVWVGNEKLAAIGVKLFRGWITGHGFAVNVGADLDGFRHIVPCGIRDRGVTSLARRIRREPRLKSVAARCASHVARRLGRRPVEALLPEERLAVVDLEPVS